MPSLKPIAGNASANGDNGSDALYFDRDYSEFTVNNFTNNNGLLAAQIIDNQTGRTLTVNNMAPELHLYNLPSDAHHYYYLK